MLKERFKVTMFLNLLFWKSRIMLFLSEKIYNYKGNPKIK